MTEPPKEAGPRSPQDSPPPLGLNHYEEGKRAGAHPLVVIFSVIFGLWILIFFVFAPGNKRDRPDASLGKPEIGSSHLDDEASAVIFRVHATVPEYKAISLIIPPEATNSQIISLLKDFHAKRMDNSLTSLLPATTPGNTLGDHAIADIYLFSDPTYATPEVVGTLALGAHAPGGLYPSAIPFEVAMEQVRGRYQINLNNSDHPDRASLGFADESGVHSKNYKPIF
ncbi:MAG TPA: hypothetical protein VLA99_14725 [Nitrospiraceae bacterium]|nr:hypothetical protein [Nitrospiraceae bacterium]